MRGRTFRFKSPPSEAIVPGTRFAPAVRGKRVSANRRGSRESRRWYARASTRGRRGPENARPYVPARVWHTKRRFLRCFVGRRDCSRAREWRDTRGTRNVAEGAETSRKNRRTNPQLYPLQGRFLEIARRSALGLIHVYNLLPQQLVDRKSLCAFQKGLQQLVLDRGKRGAANWEVTLSPRLCPMSPHPLLK